MSSVRGGVILTLDYLLGKSLNGPKCNTDNIPTGQECLKYIEEITNAYNELFNAACSGDKQKTVALVNQGLDLCATTVYGKTVLTFAASKGIADICKSLVVEVSEKYKADVNHKDKNQNTALEYAILYGHQAAIEVLKETNDGNTDLQDSIKRYFTLMSIGIYNFTKLILLLKISAA